MQVILRADQRLKQNHEDVLRPAHLQELYLSVKDLGLGRWSFLKPGSEKKWYSIYIDRPRGEWDRVAELMMIKFGESGHPGFRTTSPLSRGRSKAKEVETHRYSSVPMGIRLKLFRTIISVNQLSIYGAVQMCVRNTVHVKQLRGDPCWEDNLTHCSSQQNY